MALNISNVKTTIEDGKTKLSATVGQEALWYEVDRPVAVKNPGDVFVCASLAYAMKKNVALKLDDEFVVSQKLYESLKEYQTIFNFWYPDLLHIVDIEANVAPSQTAEEKTGSFFSGGADSLYSALVNEKEIDALIFIHGLDMQLDNQKQFEAVYQANKRYADSRSKDLILVTTNMRYLPTGVGLSWPLHCQGLGLASVAHLLGYGKVFVPASYTYAELFPCASHPLTDPMLSTEGVALFHDGATRRSEKIKKIAKDRNALDMLRVCWHDNGYNCGECEKCVRTMLTLKLLGVNSKSFPELGDIKVLEKFRMHDKSEFTFLEDSIGLAEEMGRTEDYSYLASLKKKVVFKRALIDVEKAVFAGKLKKLFSKLKG